MTTAAALTLGVKEARAALPQTLRQFSEQGAGAEPVFIGAHRKPIGVLLPFARYIELLDQLDDLAIAATILKRDQEDNGRRTSLTNRLIRSLGLDPAKVRRAAEKELQNR